METIDDEILDGRAWTSSTARSRRDQPFFVWFNRRACTSTRTRSQSRGHRRGLGVLRRRDGRARRPRRPAARRARRPRHRREHDRDLLDRQRCGGASPGPTAAITPFRGEKNTTGRAPIACRAGPLARHDPGRHRFQRHRLAPGLAADPDGRRRRARRQGAVAGAATRPASKTFKVHLDGYNQLDHLTGGAPSPRQSSSTSTTGAISPASVTTGGSSSCSSSGPGPGCLGRALRPAPRRPASSICAATPSSGP